MTCCALVFARQAASVIQRHWVEVESDTAGDKDSATNNHQVLLSYQVTIRKANVLLYHTPAPVTPSTSPPNENASSAHLDFFTARKHISRTWRLFLPGSGFGGHAEASDYRNNDGVVLRLTLSGAYVRMGLRNDKGLEMDGAVNVVAVYGAGGAEVLSIHPSVLSAVTKGWSRTHPKTRH